MLLRSKLQNVHDLGGSGNYTARCPACAAVGLDDAGNHLKVWNSGKFACVINPGSAGKFHRKEIFRLAGDPDSKSEFKEVRWTIRVRRR